MGGGIYSFFLGPLLCWLNILSSCPNSIFMIHCLQSLLSALSLLSNWCWLVLVCISCLLWNFLGHIHLLTGFYCQAAGKCSSHLGVAPPKPWWPQWGDGWWLLNLGPTIVVMDMWITLGQSWLFPGAYFLPWGEKRERNHERRVCAACSLVLFLELKSEISWPPRYWLPNAPCLLGVPQPATLSLPFSSSKFDCVSITSYWRVSLAHPPTTITTTITFAGTTLCKTSDECITLDTNLGNFESSG